MSRGLIIAAPRSGSGKTTITIALVAALRRRGIAVRTAKSGPDYIDPAFHQAASGHPSMNLDSWAMPPDLLGAIVADQAQDASLLIIESAMGLFDGVGDERYRRGAAADLAARFNLPVLLVLDVSGQSQSAAAVARGFALHDPDVRLAGVVLNRAGSVRHRDSIAEAMARAGIAVLGSVMRDAALALPERHLGLVQAGEHAGLDAYIDTLADLAERDFTIDAILEASAALNVMLLGSPTALRPPGQRIALARDDAFSFIYPHILAGWRAAGATITPFSPLADEPPPAACDACWLPGGYPELHAGNLAAATRFQFGLRDFAATRPVHGECGGFMVLGAALEDAGGATHAMSGLLSHETSFARRKLHLGYREAELCADSGLGTAGSKYRGHEFHYAQVTAPGTDAPLALMRDAAGQSLGPAGARRGQVSGSFFHVIAPVSAL
ncbi:MAG: cobyrinate a,c-diamide synthase [Acidiphilium sp.]|nr:cobyrinate a,c-diamide synthase [Acidiphilium sp.]MDD4935574.1 cobyrinate a,c-diamide synthase [Acidiphilium sp.]